MIPQQLSVATNDTLKILGNREIIAINQDPVVGTSISPFRWGINVRSKTIILQQDTYFLIERLD